MNNEIISVEAERLYREHGFAAARLERKQDVISRLANEVEDLRAGRATTSMGLGSEHAQRQVDIIFKNLNNENYPDREKARVKLQETITRAVAHKDEHFEEYVNMAHEEVEASTPSSSE